MTSRPPLLPGSEALTVQRDGIDTHMDNDLRAFSVFQVETRGQC